MGEKCSNVHVLQVEDGVKKTVLQVLPIKKYQASIAFVIVKLFEGGKTLSTFNTNFSIDNYVYLV